MEVSDKKYAKNHQIFFCWACHWFIKGADAQGREGLQGWERWEGSESIKMEKNKILF